MIVGALVVCGVVSATTTTSASAAASFPLIEQFVAVKVLVAVAVAVFVHPCTTSRPATVAVVATFLLFFPSFPSFPFFQSTANTTNQSLLPPAVIFSSDLKQQQQKEDHNGTRHRANCRRHNLHLVIQLGWSLYSSTLYSPPSPPSSSTASVTIECE